MNISDHNHYMALALQLAEQGRLSVSPNPMVGCVIVKNNQVIAKGAHQFAGGPHAEIVALQQAGCEARGAAVYVILEPCCHYGRTPPCTNALIEAGVKKVFVACLDPNPLVAGKGVQLLQRAGIHVEVGVYEQEAKALNEIFFHYITRKRPFVISKWAMSLDGKTSVNGLDDKQISGDSSKQITHEMRRQVDAILVGSNTVLSDDPSLTARTEMTAKQPVRIVLAGKKFLPESLRIFKDPISKTIIVATKTILPYVSHIKANHVEILVVRENKEQKVHLPSLLESLAKKEISSLLVEGGMTVHQNFLTENLVNKLYVHLSPKLIGTFPHKKIIKIEKMQHAGEDFHFIADLMGDTNV